MDDTLITKQENVVKKRKLSQDKELNLQTEVQQKLEELNLDSPQQQYQQQMQITIQDLMNNQDQRFDIELTLLKIENDNQNYKVLFAKDCVGQEISIFAGQFCQIVEKLEINKLYLFIEATVRQYKEKYQIALINRNSKIQPKESKVLNNSQTQVKQQQFNFQLPDQPQEESLINSQFKIQKLIVGKIINILGVIEKVVEKRKLITKTGPQDLMKVSMIVSDNSSIEVEMWGELAQRHLKINEIVYFYQFKVKEDKFDVKYIQTHRPESMLITESELPEIQYMENYVILKRIQNKRKAIKVFLNNKHILLQEGQFDKFE